MAFQAGGTDYQGFLRQRAQADEGVTRAMERKARADKQARIKKSGERSGIAKLGSAVVRGAAAYYTGGMSEQMGAGGMIDEAMLGTDSEGKAVRNEYGEMVGVASKVYEGSKAMKAGKLGEQDAKFDKLMDRRQSNVKMLFEAGDKKGAMKAQSAMEDMRLKYDTNRKDAEGKGWGGSGLGMSDEDYNIQPGAMTSGQRAAKVARLNKGEDQDTQAIIGDQGRRQEGQLGLPPTADAPKAPDLSQVGSAGPATYETQRGPDLSKIGKAGPEDYNTSQRTPKVSAALQSSPALDQRTEMRKQEQDDLIKRITGKGDKAPSDDEMKQKQKIANWMRTDLTVQPQQFGDDKFTRALDPSTGTKWGRDYLNRNAIRQGRG
jgi:hypothetical protein